MTGEGLDFGGAGIAVSALTFGVISSSGTKSIAVRPVIISQEL